MNMDIFAGDGRFGVGMGLGGFKYEWKKDNTISLIEDDGSKYKRGVIMVLVQQGDFIEAIEADGRVVAEGGDGDTLWVPVSKKAIRLRFKELARPSISKAELDKALTTVTRYLYSDSPYSLGLDTKLSAAIAILQGKLEEIPGKYRDTAEIEFRNRHEYGESYENVTITWKEPETDEELIRRLQIEAERGRLSRIAKKRQLEKLKAEVGD
jgi:hypothetical protein